MDYQRNIANIFNVAWINQWYLSKNEASRHSIYFIVKNHFSRICQIGSVKGYRLVHFFGAGDPEFYGLTNLIKPPTLLNMILKATKLSKNTVSKTDLSDCHMLVAIFKSTFHTQIINIYHSGFWVKTSLLSNRSIKGEMYCSNSV